MRIGIPATLDVDATAERCRQLGVNTVFVSCASLPGYKERGYPDVTVLRSLKDGLEQRGIAVPSATYWFAKWPARPWRQGSTNPDILLTRDRTCIDAMKRMLEILGEAGITSILHYVDLGRPLDPTDQEACWDGLIDIYKEVIPVAEAHGIGIGNHSLHRLFADGVREKAVAAGVRIEDYDSYAAEGWGGPFLVGNWKELARLVDAVPSPRTESPSAPVWTSPAGTCHPSSKPSRERFTSASFGTTPTAGRQAVRSLQMREGSTSQP